MGNRAERHERETEQQIQREQKNEHWSEMVLVFLQKCPLVKWNT